MAGERERDVARGENENWAGALIEGTMAPSAETARRCVLSVGVACEAVRFMAMDC